MFSFSKHAREPGWLAVCRRDRHVEFAHVTRESGKKPVLRQYFSEPLASGEDGLLSCLRGFSRRREARGFRYTTLLAEGYQFIQVEAPAVPEAELKDALRWKLKDLCDIPGEAAVFDILPLPEGGSLNRAQQLFLAVANKNSVAPVVQVFQEAGLELDAIDLPELAQRNVAELFEDENRGLAFLAFGENSALLTFTFHGELFAFRRIEIGSVQIAQATEERRAQLTERVVLEMQRSMDTVDRQFSSISLSKMIVALPPESGLEEQFRRDLYLSFEAMDLARVIDLSACPALADSEAQRRALGTIGAALRSDEVAA